MSSTLIADAEKQKARMAICQACPHAAVGRTKKFICGKCGCPLVSKTKLSGARCPVGKW